MIHSLRGAAMTIASPVRMLGGAVAAPFNAIGNAIGNAGASSETLSELKKENPLIVLCLVSLLLLTFYLREGDTGMIHSLRGAAMTIASPVRMLGGAVAAPFNAIGNAIGNAGASSETLSELKKENERLTAKVAELSEAQETAARLEKLVGLQSTYSLKSTAARIIGSTGDAWSNAVIIDKGANAGFEVGMPVCSSGGVIGQIIEVSATTSTVRLVSDEQSGISAMVQGSRAQGMLFPRPRKRLLGLRSSSASSPRTV